MSERTSWREHQDRWEAERLRPALERGPERQARFITQSGVEIDRLYTPADLPTPPTIPDRGRPRYRFSPREDGAVIAGWDEIDDLGLPGEPPFTRGIHPTGHRGRLWTMRMFAGFGTAEDTNDRFKKLIAAGGTGLSIAYDMPTLYGYDHDEPDGGGRVRHLRRGGLAAWPTWRSCSTGCRSARSAPRMTINSPAADDLGDVHRGRREDGRAARPAGRARCRTTSSRSSSPRRSTSSRPPRRSSW